MCSLCCVGEVSQSGNRRCGQLAGASSLEAQDASGAPLVGLTLSKKVVLRTAPCEQTRLTHLSDLHVLFLCIVCAVFSPFTWLQLQVNLVARQKDLLNLIRESTRALCHMPQLRVARNTRAPQRGPGENPGHAAQDWLCSVRSGSPGMRSTARGVLVRYDCTQGR